MRGSSRDRRAHVVELVERLRVTITSDNPDPGGVREELEAEFNADPIARHSRRIDHPRRAT